MRKRNKKVNIFSRPKNQRTALLRALAAGLFLSGKIETTEAKAKEARIFAEKCITKAKNGGLANRRILAGEFSPKVVKKIFDDIAPQYVSRSGGYTRMAKIGPRKSDGAKMAIIELVK